jgi:hypothetical protein
VRQVALQRAPPLCSMHGRMAACCGNNSAGEDAGNATSGLSNSSTYTRKKEMNEGIKSE